MFLKSLDIVGYKSFAQKTHLDLSQGIIGIMGPNGCGKSNIIESVRWCLGEMSWKSLRADSMVEVIFNGTQKRQALSMAEVTLTFDNTQSGLPVQYSEVVITRRLFRSGESQYFLNKTQCRLRDIRELFLDTGVGGDGYAIIDQGSVEAVLTYNPEERRSLFEEAAGVAKYKAKREEALRKLEHVETDMARLGDSLSLVTDQVKKLDSDARKAEQYRKYKERLAAMEAANLVRQIETAQGQASQVSAKMAPLQDALGNLKTSLDTRGAEGSSLKLERAQKQNEVMAANEKMSGVRSEIARNEERVRSAGQHLREFESRIAAITAEAASLDKRLVDVLPEIEAAKAATSGALASYQAVEREVESAKGRSEALVRAKEEAEESLKALEREIFDLTERAMEGRNGLSEFESRRLHKEAEERAAHKDFERDSAQQQRAQQELAEIEASLVLEGNALKAAQERLEAAEADLAGKKRRLEALSEEILRLHEASAVAQARLESLRAEAEQDPYWRGAVAVVAAGLPGVVGTVRRLFTTDEKTQAELADILGERLHALVCEDSQSAADAVEWLKVSGKGRARILVLSSLDAYAADRAYPSEARPLVERLTFDPRHETAIRHLLGECYGLRGAVYSDHWVYGGGESQSPTGAASFSDIDGAQANLNSLKERMDAVSAEKVHLQGETAQAEEGAAQARRTAVEKSASLDAISRSKTKKEEEISLCAQSVELARSQAAQISTELAQIRERAEAARDVVDGIAKSEAEAKARHTAFLHEIATVHAEAAQAASSSGLWQSRLTDAQETLRLREEALGKLSGEKESLASVRERLQAERGDLNRKIGETQELSKTSSEYLEELRADEAAAAASSQGLFARLSDLDASIRLKEEEIQSLQKDASTVEHELHAIELELSAAKSSEDVLKRRLAEDHGVEFETAKAAIAEEPDAEKMEFLRKRIASLGNVNLAAAEEYQALTERQTFLSTQLQDLTKAKDDLKDAIQKINSSTRENFRETFTQVREHFVRIFGVLFEGGSADLVLTLPDNMLETGIDIVAQPPGKKLQSLSLLSGGEKALTAVALLFAFFMVKPSPFCMMDEADAALDDANVERFVNLLREFGSRTQFLIVSHNKRTMEAAEAIYGVTMEELGVSQLVSVDFRKKETPQTPPVSEGSHPESPISA